MNLARELAQRIVTMRYEDLPPPAIHASKVAVMDTMGVMLAGSAEEASRLVEATLGADAAGPCHILGSGRRAACLDAALVNGTAAHVLDFDNGSNSMGGHVSATVIPALLAAAETCGAGGRELLLAHAVGFEVGTRIGHGVNFQHYEKGWHPTSTLGTFAVIGACASLLKLSAEQTATALALGTSLASGIKANFGTMTKPLHVGHCARNGLFAVLLAQQGYTAGADAFGHEQGFFNVFNGRGNYAADRILQSWAAPLEIVNPGAGYKQYPCCAATHAALDAVLELVRRHGRFDAGDLARIETWTSARRLAHTNRPDPTSNLDAKFSVQYCVSRALLEGTIGLEHFEGHAYRDPVVREVMRRVNAATHRPGQFAPDNHFGAEVKVTLSNGTSDSARVDIQLGRTADNPIPAARLRSKFANCAARVLPPDTVTRLGDMIDALDALPSVRELIALAAPPAAAGFERSVA